MCAALTASAASALRSSANSFDACTAWFATSRRRWNRTRNSHVEYRVFISKGLISRVKTDLAAYPKEHARDPDWDEFRRFQDAAGGRIGMVTLAPERTDAIAFIEKLTASGVVVAIGHTAATGAANPRCGEGRHAPARTWSNT